MLPLGCYAWFGYVMPLDKRLELIKQAGFEATGLWFEAEEEIVSAGCADDMPTMIRDHGLLLDNIHAPFWNTKFIWSDSKELRAKVREELASALAFCGKHHIPIMVVHAVGGSPSVLPQSGLLLLRDLVRQAEDSNVIIALENLDDGSLPFYTDAYLDSVFANITSPNLRFCYDSGHDFLSNERRGRALQQWGHLLAATHFSDNMGKHDDHVLPGQGTIDWDVVRRDFPKDSYKGALMLEVEPQHIELSVERFLQSGYDWLRRFGQSIDR